MQISLNRPQYKQQNVNFNGAISKALTNATEKYSRAVAPAFKKAVEGAAKNETTLKAIDYFDMEKAKNWMPVVTSLWLSGWYVLNTLKNPKIEHDRKKTLAVNQTIVAVASAIVSLRFSSAVLKISNSIIEPIKRSKIKDPILAKHVELFQFLVGKKNKEMPELLKSFAEKSKELKHVLDGKLEDAGFLSSLKLFMKHEEIEDLHKLVSQEGFAKLSNSKVVQSTPQSIVDTIEKVRKKTDFERVLTKLDHCLDAETSEIQDLTLMLSKPEKPNQEILINSLNRYKALHKSQVGKSAVLTEEQLNALLDVKIADKLNLTKPENALAEVAKISQDKVESFNSAFDKIHSKINEHLERTKLVDTLKLNEGEVKKLSEIRPLRKDSKGNIIEKDKDVYLKLMNFIDVADTIKSIEFFIPCVTNIFTFRILGPILATPAATVVTNMFLDRKKAKEQAALKLSNNTQFRGTQLNQKV